MKKRGRPTDNPKPDRINVALDRECVEIIESYCEKHNVSKAEVIRRGVKRLKDEM